MTERDHNTDLVLESDVRTMLLDRAGDVTPDQHGWARITERIEHGDVISLSPAGRAVRRSRPLLAAAVLAAVLGIGGVLAIATRDDGTVDTGPAAPASGEIAVPAWFDPFAAAPVYQSGTNVADDTVRDYLASRFADFPRPAVRYEQAPELVEPYATSDTVVKATTYTWSTSEEDGTIIASGSVWLRIDAEENEWEVVGAFTDQVEIASLAYANEAISVTGTNRSGQTAQVVFRTFDGVEVQRWTVDDDIEAAIDARYIDGHLVAIELVGGTTLGITELRVDGPKVRPVWPYEPGPADPNGESPEAVAAAFVSRAIGAIVTETTVGNVAEEHAALRVEVASGPAIEVVVGFLDGRWWVTSAVSEGLVVEHEVDAAPEPTITVDITGPAGEVLVGWAPPGTGPFALDAAEPVAIVDGRATVARPFAGPTPLVLSVLLRPAEEGPDLIYVDRIG